MTETTILLLIIIAQFIVGLGVFLWEFKGPKECRDNDSTEEKLRSLPNRYFYCIQDSSELPKADPMLFAEGLLRDSEERVEIYMGIDFPLSLGGHSQQIAKKAYAKDNRNFTHLSATLNERIRTLKTFGLAYPDVLQICNKIIALTEKIDSESQKRNLICATNLFPKRYMRSYRVIYGNTPVHERNEPAWSEINDVFCYTEEELLS